MAARGVKAREKTGEAGEPVSEGSGEGQRGPGERQIDFVHSLSVPHNHNISQLFVSDC